MSSHFTPVQIGAMMLLKRDANGRDITNKRGVPIAWQSGVEWRMVAI
jgi:hypothetical protein